MRDVFGRVISVGDEVAFMLPSYRSLGIRKSSSPEVLTW